MKKILFSFTIVFSLGVFSLLGCSKKKAIVQNKSVTPEVFTVLPPKNNKAQKNLAQQISQSVKIKSETPKTCFTDFYHHKALEDHPNEESCSQHKNLIRLGHERVNLTSICVRVDGIPVNYQVFQKSSFIDLLLDPVAGPHAKISASYCLRGHTCKKQCKVPKDEFLEALTGDEKQMSGKIAKWDPSDKDEDQSLSDLDAEVEKELLNTEGLKTFEGWVKDSSEDQSCNMKGV